LTEKKNYLNMAIRLKRNFKRFYFKSFYFKRILKSKIKRYNRFLKLHDRYGSATKRSCNFKNLKKGRVRVKKLRLTKFKRVLFIKKLYKLGYKRRYFFNYLRRRIECIRLKKFLFKYRWKNKKRLWKRTYRKGFKKLYFNFFKKSSSYAVRHFKTANIFYKTQGLYPFLKSFVKYSRLKLILARYGKALKGKKKKIICKLSRSRVEKLVLLNVFFQGLVSGGKKKLSLNIFQKLFLLLKFRYKKNFIDSYLQFLEKIRPLIFYKVMFIGGKKYKIPTLMPISKSYSTSIRWLISNADKKDIATSLFNNINSTLKNEGSLIKYRKEYHSASFENKSYIRFLKFLKTGF